MKSSVCKVMCWCEARSVDFLLISKVSYIMGFKRLLEKFFLNPRLDRNMYVN